MYSAKDNGRNNCRFFTEDMNAQVVERLTLESGLRAALDRKELFLVYQPQMDIAYWKDHRGWKRCYAGNTRNWALCHPINSSALRKIAG